MGDQFLALAESPTAAARPPDYLPKGHFGLTVDDWSRTKNFAVAAGARLVEGAFLDFLGSWENWIEVVDYADIQFTKARVVHAGMNLDLHKTDTACRQLAEKGMSPWAEPAASRLPS